MRLLVGRLLRAFRSVTASTRGNQWILILLELKYRMPVTIILAFCMNGAQGEAEQIPESQL
jgi:hypothetical protein